MTDHMIHADKVRAILANRGMRADEMIAKIEAILPPPPRPTLADMTREERRACRRMQCDVEGRDGRWVIVAPYSGDGDAVVISDDGDMGWISTDLVTPRPDLPRLEWPGDTEAAPAPEPAPALPAGWRLADHKVNGRVIVTNTTPTRDGRVYYLLPDADPLGFDWLSCDHSELTYLDTDQGAGTPTGPGHLAVGTVIESADDPRIYELPVGSVLLDLDEEAAIKGRGGWEGAGYIPIPSEGAELGPWTVLHIPKENHDD